MSEAVAALDCGTNSTRLAVAGADGEVLERRGIITRLGEGLDASGRLAPAAIGRTLEALREFRKVMDAAGVERAMASATAAVRDSANGEELLAPASEILGVRPEVLSGEEEGRLSFAGATRDLSGPCVVFDVGGGSTEIIVGEAGSEPAGVCSVRLGCVRLTERHLPEPVTTAALLRASAEAEALVKEALGRLPAIPAAAAVIGLAGTVTSLSAMEQRLENYDPRLVHHSTLTRAQVQRWIEVLAAQSVEARAAQPGLEPSRAPVILGGAIAVAAVLSALGATEMLVSESDILDGMVARLRGN